MNTIPMTTPEQIASDAFHLETGFLDKPSYSLFRIGTNVVPYCRLWIRTDEGFLYLGVCKYPEWEVIGV